MLFVLALPVGSCGKKGGASADAKLLAKVYDAKLYSSDVDPNLIPAEASAEDSARIMTIFVENWIQNQLTLRAAEQTVQSDAKIEKLVNDYRSSLLLQEYEKYLMREKLDSNITGDEYQKFYTANQSKYKLQETVSRMMFIKAPSDFPGLDSLRSWWLMRNEGDYDKLLLYCNDNQRKLSYSLEEDKWFSVSFIEANMPVSAGDLKAAVGRDYITADSSHTYMLKVSEFAPAGSMAPMSYAAPDIATFILHQRKLHLLDSMQKDLFNNAKKSNKIEIFSNWPLSQNVLF